MNEGKIAVRYARALYSLAKEEKITEKIKSDLQEIQSIISGSQEFSELLENPVIRQSRKKELVKLIFSKQVHPVTLKFLDLLIENKRESYISGVIRVFSGLYQSESGIHSALLTTATPLDEQTKKTITSYISDKLKMKIDLEEQVDEKIIGGFVLKIDNRQIDASVASGLKKVKKELLNR